MELFEALVRKCYRPQVKVCNGQGPEQCRTVFETDCVTKVRRYCQPGKCIDTTKSYE